MNGNKNHNKAVMLNTISSMTHDSNEDGAELDHPMPKVNSDIKN